MNFYAWPDTEHPAYQEQAAMIRHLMETRRGVILLPKLDRARSFEALESQTFETTTTESTMLMIKNAYGPAPYVGKPFCYVWKVAVDELERWVAGPAEISR
jgi:hypothetical protein